MNVWRVDRYGDKTDLYALFDPSNNVAKAGTEVAMKEALREVETRLGLHPTTGPTQPEAPKEDYGAGDPIVVLYWQEFMVGGEDKGHWDTVEGVVVGVGPKRICYELGARSFPERWGGDFEASPGSLLRHIAREWVFLDAEKAKAASTKLVPPKRK
jgi:hypothetical protein